MFMSTLPAVPGYSYQVRGLVYAANFVMSRGGLDVMTKSLMDQGARFGADAIIDVKTVVAGGDNAKCVMTGTAIRLIPNINA
jgi:hypothetical protein